MLRENYETIKTGRGLITTVNHNIPDSLNDIPLHKDECRGLVVFGGKKKSWHRNSEKKNTEKKNSEKKNSEKKNTEMNLVAAAQKRDKIGVKGGVGSEGSGMFFFFFESELF
jgi:hypothetical protein